MIALSIVCFVVAGMCYSEDQISGSDFLLLLQNLSQVIPQTQTAAGGRLSVHNYVALVDVVKWPRHNIHVLCLVGSKCITAKRRQHCSASDRF